MNSIDVIEKISNTFIINDDLKYCLVDSNKLPFRVDGVMARPNTTSDFVSFEELLQSNYLNKFVGIGISIQGSNICAIDVDHCFKIPRDITSGDERAKYFLDLFKDIAYCEFSFSGTGLRILFKQTLIDDYSNKYYIKNEKCGVEYYQPSNSFRYVTVTGDTIYNNPIDNSKDFKDIIISFLDKYMIRTSKLKIEVKNSNEIRSYDELMKLVKKAYRKDPNFQDLWFNPAPGSGKDESERDYHLVAYLYENITQDKDLLKQIFETSDFYKTKDYKHKRKWSNQDFRYFNYLFNIISQ